MAQLLTTKEILAALDNIIKKAEKYICIFTYNIKIDQNYLSRLRNASKRNVTIIIVFGVDNGDPDVVKEVLNLPNTTVYFKEYLHAKFYYNEKELLVGSMNLSEASAKNNFELGVLFKDEEYQSVIKKVKEEANEIINDSVKFEGPKRELPILSSAPRKGACVRCAKAIEYNPSKPLCHQCYGEWSEWENEYYQEEFCHSCGQKRFGISFAFPQCKSCYNRFSQSSRKANQVHFLQLGNRISNLHIDNRIKEIIANKLRLNSNEISIDFDLQKYFMNVSQKKSVIDEIEKQFDINLSSNRPSIKDYWDLYSAVARAIGRDG
ncbi:PLD-like domain-containing protein [Chryseolinea serpens]|uniref:PLD-like domain-containing protein n=1 Tax=Chryseolinea serpens TaxID=947013 RepID=A0A1M5P1J0_9BACT|nr:phospholipase D-like domain-containing protein [Chryseolinea serpens]SHG95670.1 PLD-like domain-containing protein [Chryseolinea serpens]